MTPKTEIAALVERMRLLCAAIENSPRWTWERDQGMAADIRTLLSLVAERDRMREALEKIAAWDDDYVIGQPSAAAAWRNLAREQSEIARAALTPASKEPSHD